MARTITQIKAGMTADFMANETLAGYYGYTVGDSFDTHFSTVSIESILFYIVAVGVWVLENLFDTLKSEVDADLSARLTHNRQWYVNLAKAFQFGDALNNNTGSYDVIDTTKQVVDYAAVDEIAGKLFLKVAKEGVDNLEALSSAELTAFNTYISKTKDAGVVVNIISQEGDQLRLVIDVFYDPMVLGADGVLLTGTEEPVKDTLQQFIQGLPFNGEFQIVKLVDALQATEGVVIPTVLSAESKYAANDWATIDAKVKPYAGYLTIDDEDLTINYRPYDAD